MTFGRLRVQGSGGLCPAHDYTVVTPYGSWTVTTDDLGGLKPGANTTDVGCTPTPPDVPCDYSLALRSDVLGGFLRWDPSQLPTAPAGYLGDPNVLHTVVGAPYHRDGSPVNYVAVYDGAVDPANLVVQTDKFNVMGKLGGPLVADPSSAVFPDPLPVGATPASRTVTLSNQGIDPITVNGFSVNGAAAGSFSVGTSTCQSALAPGASCSVEVLFSPADVGTQNAALIVDHTGLNSPLSVPLSGVGTPSDGNGRAVGGPHVGGVRPAAHGPHLAASADRGLQRRWHGAPDPGRPRHQRRRGAGTSPSLVGTARQPTRSRSERPATSRCASRRSLPVT